MNVPVGNPPRLPALRGYDVMPELASRDDPRREMILGGVVIFLFFGVFMGWSLIAHLDAAAYGVGQIGVEGHRQTIQHREGGAISAIYVKEGQHVTAGQVMISLAPAEVEAGESAMASHVINLEALRARLLAERLHTSIAEPREFVGLTGEDRTEADEAMRVQRAEMIARARSISSQKSVYGQRAAQLNAQITGLNQQVDATDRQSKLIGDELSATQTLADKGYASINRLRALERDAAGLSGSRADQASNAARARAQIGETEVESIGLDNQRQEEIAKDLRDTENDLSDSLPKLAQLKIQLANTQIRAPSSGTVVGLQVYAVGGVVAPGQKILDIVPDSAPLVMQVQFTPKDADSVHVGQKAEVRVTAISDRRIPVLNGQVTMLAADSVVDDKTGNRFFTGEVTVPVKELDKIKAVRGPLGGIRAGLPVQVIIPLRKRTALQYLTEPLTSAFWGSFREH